MNDVETRLRVATVDDVEVAGKRVLLRVDFNVPLKDGVIVDDRRIRAALPTIESLRRRGARVIVATHIGRPKGIDPTLSTAVVAKRLGELLGCDVAVATDVVGVSATRMSAALADGAVMMLENVRFEPGETRDDPELARGFAGLADLYANDAFGTAHRAHASTHGVAAHLPAVAGLLMAEELRVLGGVLDNAAPPVVAVIGGSKISTKLGVVTSLIDRVDTLWIGGAMACTFYRALGKSTGTSLVEDDQIDTAHRVYHDAAKHRADLRLPIDVVIAEKPEAGSPSRVVGWQEIPDGWMVVDVGPETVTQMAATCYGAGTVVWNGPLGIYEIPDFAKGTTKLAEALARVEGVTVIGGGDLGAAVEAAGVADKMSFISTGGGATLEFLEGRVLPGVAVLMERRGA